MLPNRYAFANDPKLDNYDCNKPKKVIKYYNVRNLYGKCMTEPMPVNNFKFLSAEEIENLNLEQIKDDNETGYILEVDLTYPEHLHEKHNDFPLAPEKNSTKCFTIC